VDTRLFEDVLVLLEEGSLSRAAERRNLTQPAFSRRIRAFEEWVGVALLDREANRIALHPRLAANADEIRGMVTRMEALRGRLRSEPGNGQRLVFATQHALSTTVVPAILDGFQRGGRRLSARLRTMNREDCISLFVRGESDFLVIYEARGLPPLPFDASIRRHTWMRDTLVPVCGGSMRYRLGPDRRPREAFPVIGYPPDSHFGRLLARYGALNAMLADGGSVTVETAFSIGVHGLVAHGMGVGWLPHSLCHWQLASGDLVDLCEAYGQIPLDVSLFYLANDPDSEALVSGL
jgi:DNA-binding transcriptional LysR family regulator